MSAYATGTADDEHGGQQQCRQFQTTVTKFTCEQSVHDFGYLCSIIRSVTSVPVCGPPLNLIAPRTGSSFDVRAHSVNALTEELGYIRFPVQAGQIFAN
jgi:hypothetical protein